MKSVPGALLILACVPAPLLAEEHEMCAHGMQCRIASHAELDELRGGFDFDTDRGRLRIGFGITRSVSVNDRVVATSNFVIPDLGRFARGRGGHHQNGPGGQTLQQSGGNVAPGSQIVVNNLPFVGSNGPIEVTDKALIVQIGDGNTAPSASTFQGGSLLPTIVQNTLDNQKISTSTLVSTSVNSLSVMNTLRFGDALRRATAASGR